MNQNLPMSSDNRDSYAVQRHWVARSAALDGKAWPGLSTLCAMPHAVGLGPLQAYCALRGGKRRSAKLNCSRTKLKPSAFWRSITVTRSAPTGL